MRLRATISVVLLVVAATMPRVMAVDDLAAIAAGRSNTATLSGLQVSLMQRDKKTDSFAYGFAQINEGSPTPLSSAHKVRIASISKLVLAIGFMQLVEQGQLDLDADVSDVLGWRLRNPHFPDKPITARQLLAHTSSLRDGRRYWLPAGERLRDFFVAGTKAFEDGAHFAAGAGKAPGQYFNYSNLNFGVLGSLIEIASGQRFDQFMKTSVLVPMGLSASYNPCDIKNELRAAAFRKRDTEGRWHPDGPWRAQVDAGSPSCFYGMQNDDPDTAARFEKAYVLGSNGTLFSPQGGLRASADDLIVILKMLANGGHHNGRDILTTSSVETMLTPEWTYDPNTRNGNTTGEDEPGGPTEGLMTSYGLSVHRISLPEWGMGDTPRLLVGHLGEAYGVLSHALYDPQTGDGIATIITGSADNPAKAPAGTSPLYRVEEDILRWWLAKRRRTEAK